MASIAHPKTDNKSAKALPTNMIDALMAALDADAAHDELRRLLEGPRPRGDPDRAARRRGTLPTTASLCCTATSSTSGRRQAATDEFTRKSSDHLFLDDLLALPRPSRTGFCRPTVFVRPAVGSASPRSGRPASARLHGRPASACPSAQPPGRPDPAALPAPGTAHRHTPKSPGTKLFPIIAALPTTGECFFRLSGQQRAVAGL